jgi:hypothetical protein
VAAPDPGIPGNEIAFTRDRAARVPWLRRAAVAVVFAGLAAAAGAALGPAMFVVAGVFGLGAVGCAVSYAWQGRFRTVLTPQGIELHGYVSHHVLWQEVTGFRVRNGQAGAKSGLADVNPVEHVEGDLGRPGQVFMTDGGRQAPPGQPHVTVQVLRTSGRRLVLPAPVVSGRAGDYQFTDSVRQLEEWRRRYGPQAPTPQ